jgi:hypothetical protein
MHAHLEICLYVCFVSFGSPLQSCNLDSIEYNLGHLPVFNLGNVCMYLFF